MRVEAGKGEIGPVLGQLGARAAALDDLATPQAGGAAEDDQIDQPVRTQAVGAMHRDAGGLADGHQAGTT